MKKKLLIASIIFCVYAQVNAQSLLSLTAQAIPICSNLCNSNTGAASVDVQGGSPPYTFLWSNGATDQIITGLPGGPYDVTVTDAVLSAAYSNIWLGDSPVPDLNLANLLMPTPGMNNGRIDFFFYSFGSYIPDANYAFELYDSSLTLINSFYNTCVQCQNPINWSFSNLGKGTYHLSLNVSLGVCSSYIDFTLNETPAIAPTFVTLPSCNGSPTGKVVANLHFNPSLDSNTYSVYTDISAHPPAGYQTATNKYHGIVYNAGGAVAAYVPLSDSMFTGNNLSPGNYTLKIYEGGDLSIYPFALDSTLLYTSSFTIITDSNCALVKGKVFADYNFNCAADSGDVLMKNILVEINPGGFSATTSSNGEFFIPVAAGAYTLKQYAPFQYSQVCPDTNTFSVNITQGQIVDVQVADSVNVNPDVQIGLTSYTQPRPGFNEVYYLTCKNITPNFIPANTVTLNYNPALTFISTQPAATTNTTGQLTWSVSGLNPFEERTFSVTLNVPSPTPLGTILNADANANVVAGETSTLNNYDSIAQTVTGSFDPNEKEVTPVGYDPSGYIPNTELLKYTIRFQNTGTDTAFTVTVADTLPLSLDKYSLQVLDASHSYWYEFKNPNVVLFHFDNILLPDSNVNEEASHGFIKFSIEQNPGNASGTIIQNNAAIYFDFNVPVSTNEVMNTVFDCNQLATPASLPSFMCESDNVILSSNLLFPMNVAWYLDTVLVTNSSDFNLSVIPFGNYQVTMIASNPSCSQTFILGSIHIDFSPKPVISVNGNLLTSSYGPVGVGGGNEWFFNGVLIPGANQQTYLATQTGWYVVNYITPDLCERLSDSIYVVVSGINENDLMNYISVLPNPANNFIIIRNTLKTLNDLNLQIRDVAGKIILTQKINSHSTQIEVSNLAKGIYVVEVSTQNKKGYYKIAKE